MNVLAIPTGGVGHCRSVVPMFIGLLRSAGDANGRVLLLSDFGAYGSERERADLADAVERYRGNVQVFVRCLDDAVVSTANLETAQDVLARRRTFWGEHAWNNLGRWIREHFDPKEPCWESVRTELDWVVQDARYGHAASLIDIASREWLERHELPLDDAEEQRRLQAQVEPLIGSIYEETLQGENASRRVSEILAEKYDRSQQGG